MRTVCIIVAALLVNNAIVFFWLQQQSPAPAAITPTSPANAPDGPAPLDVRAVTARVENTLADRDRATPTDDAATGQVLESNDHALSQAAETDCELTSAQAVPTTDASESKRPKNTAAKTEHDNGIQTVSTPDASVEQPAEQASGVAPTATLTKPRRPARHRSFERLLIVHLIYERSPEIAEQLNDWVIEARPATLHLHQVLIAALARQEIPEADLISLEVAMSRPLKDDEERDLIDAVVEHLGSGD